MKIAIIGNAGSGKSYLAMRLHELLGISVYHLDQYYWKPNWQEPDHAAFEKVHNQLCDQKKWIIEGVATKIFEYRISKADVAIFLDMPTYLCLYRIFKRTFTSFGKILPSSAKGCPERIPDLKFLKFIWNFNRERKPMIEALIQKYKGTKKTFVVKNKTDLDELIRKFKSN